MSKLCIQQNQQIATLFYSTLHISIYGLFPSGIIGCYVFMKFGRMSLERLRKGVPVHLQ